jgi:poly-gamma-glutamate capsule biosynthesis protein CapA/YwtB (metallophosphatase superfamily)
MTIPVDNFNCITTTLQMKIMKYLVFFVIGIMLNSGCAFAPKPRYNNAVDSNNKHNEFQTEVESLPITEQEELNEIVLPTEASRSLDADLITEDFELPATIKIIATGDIMLGTRIPDESYLPQIDGNELFGSCVKKILQNGDIVFGNLEGSICGSGGKAKKKKYVFAMPNESADWLSDAGYNLLSVANNHAGDMGEQGCKNTLSLLEKNDINFAGYLDFPTTIFKKNGIRIGFVATSPNSGVVYLHNQEWLKSEVRRLALQCDIVIVSMHIGAEGKDHQRVTRKTEKFMGENRGNPYQFARDMIDVGADLILGHGPHVTRAIDVYKNKFIAYSLGNFCTVSRVNLNGVNGIAPILELTLDKEGNFQFGHIHSSYQLPRKGVRIDNENKVLKKIIELTKEDIPESSLLITDEGMIIPQ